MNEAKAKESVTVEEMEAKMETLSFAVNIPSDMSFVPKDPDAAPSLAVPPHGGFTENRGIVGTVTLFGSKSIMVWFGWGHLATPDQGRSLSLPHRQQRTSNTLSIGGDGELPLSYILY